MSISCLIAYFTGSSVGKKASAKITKIKTQSIGTISRKESGLIEDFLASIMTVPTKKCCFGYKVSLSMKL